MTAGKTAPRRLVAVSRHAVTVLLVALPGLAFAAKTPSAPRPGYVLVQVMGKTDDPQERLKNPTGVAVDKDGTVYVADSGNHRIVVFSKKGRFLRSFGAESEGGARLENPVDLAITGDGTVYVADFESDRIETFTKNGKHLLGFGGSGTGDGKFGGATGIAAASDGTIYVADFYNDRIQIFDAAGTFLGKLGTEGHGMGELYYPTDLALRKDGSLLVADAYNHRIQALARDGKALPGQYDIGKALTPPLKVPTGVALDQRGRIHVADSANKRAVLLDPKGGFLAAWKMTGDEHPETYSPTRVAVSGDLVYLVDTSNDRIVILRVR